MVSRSNPSDLFFRWVMVVYLPLGLLVIQAALLPFGLLPGWMKWSFAALALYAVVAVRLLIERKRSGLGIPLPRKILVSVAILSAMLGVGLALFVLGMGRLDTSGGLAMVFLGGCLMILSVTVPTFRLVDIALRKSSRIAARLLGGSRNGQGSESTTAAPAPAGRRRSTRPPGKSSTGPARSRTKPGSRSAPARQSPVRPAKKRTSAKAPPPLLAKLTSAAQAVRLLTDSPRPRKPRPSDRTPRAQTGPIARLAIPPSPPQEP